MAGKGKARDPHADREAARYDSPIPSREFILQLLAEAEHPLTLPRVAEALGIVDEEGLEALRRRLNAMERDGQLLSNRKGAFGPVDKLDLVRGRVSGHRDGFGFLLPTDGSDDLYLSARQMATVFDGDEALCRVSGTDRRGRREGKVVEVLKHNTRQVVGRYVEDSGISFVVPDNARVNHDVMVSPEDRGEAAAGQMVMVEITQYPARHRQPRGRVIEVLGEHLDPGMEIDVAIRSHGIPHVFSEEALSEAGGLAPEPDEADKKSRLDLRDLAFVTIDGEDARDFDDAVFCQRRRGGWTLWVAIADVSHYVRPESALDEDAHTRATSVYFPEQVVPMLPESLSNGLCSLKPSVDRLALVCKMDIDKQGETTSYSFSEAVIHSHGRLTYTQVGQVLEGREPGDCDVDPALIPDLEALHDLYGCLRRARDRRGAIEFESVETRFIFNEQRKIEAIVPVVRNDAHKLIEECMLAANVAAADFLASTDLAALYRVHEGPTEEKLGALREYLGPLGLTLGGGDDPTPLDYGGLQQQLADREDGHIVQIMMLRSLKQAMYQPDNRGHFGLHYPAYAHFTSPIRRYPDLLVHRAIRSVIRSDVSGPAVERVAGASPIPRKRIYPYNMAQMLSLGEHCSLAERRADEATREVDSWLKCEYLQDRVGEVFSGVVSATTAFGLFVELTGLYVEGLVHISALPGDYYHFDAVRQRLTGERSGRSFRLGDPVVVQVARVDLDDKKIDFELVESGGSRDSRKTGRTGKRSDEAKAAGKNAAGKKVPGKKAPGKKVTSKKSTGKKAPGNDGSAKPRKRKAKPSAGTKSKKTASANRFRKGKR